MPSHLVVIYGAPFSGKSTVAWRVARSFGQPAVVVSVDHLLGGTIAVPNKDALAELEMVHIQLRLLVVSYLKNGYHVVVEGPFSFERGATAHNFESEIDQLIALMRHLTDRGLIVRLEAPESSLTARAAEQGRAGEAEAAMRIEASYKRREGARFLSFDTKALSPEAIAEKIYEAATGGFS